MGSSLGWGRKGYGARYRIQTLCVPQRVAEACRPNFSIVYHCAKDGAYDGNVSQDIPTCFDVERLSHSSMCTCCSGIFWISVRGIASYVALSLVCPLGIVQEPPLSSLWNLARLILRCLKMCVHI